MRKFLIGIVISLFVFSSSAVFAQESPAVPDLSTSDWEYMGPASPSRVIPGGIGQFVFDAYQHKNGSQFAILFIFIDKINGTEEDIAMIYGKADDELPMSAIKVDGQWYACDEHNRELPKGVELKNSNGDVVGMRFSLNTTEGLKTRDIIYP